MGIKIQKASLRRTGSVSRKNMLTDRGNYCAAGFSSDYVRVARDERNFITVFFFERREERKEGARETDGKRGKRARKGNRKRQ